MIIEIGRSMWLILIWCLDDNWCWVIADWGFGCLVIDTAGDGLTWLSARYSNFRDVFPHSDRERALSSANIWLIGIACKLTNTVRSGGQMESSVELKISKLSKFLLFTCSLTYVQLCAIYMVFLAQWSFKPMLCEYYHKRIPSIVTSRHQKWFKSSKNCALQIVTADCLR